MQRRLNLYLLLILFCFITVGVNHYTMKRLMHDINTGRKQLDPNHWGFDNVPDNAPIFLSEGE